MKKLLLTMMVALSATFASADNQFTTDDVLYTILSSKDKTVEIAQRSEGYYDDIVIPATVMNEEDGITYTVVSVGNGAFVNTPGLISLTLPETVTRIGDDVFYNSNIESITLPSKLKSIGKNAFNECKLLTAISPIPEGITEIAEGTFANCKTLASITLPSTLESVGNGSFVNCFLLKEINCKAINPPSVFNNDKGGVFWAVETEECVLNVPIGSRKNYMYDLVWSQFDVKEVELSTVIAGEQSIDVSACGEGGAVSIKTNNPAEIRIYNIQGVLEYTGQVQSEDIIYLEKGAYIVNVGQYVTKVVVR